MANHLEQDEGVQQANQPALCENGCGFFANPACGPYCSKCYREMADREQRASPKPARPQAEPGAGAATSAATGAAVPAAPQPREPVSVPAVPAAPSIEIDRPAVVAPGARDPPERRNARPAKMRCPVCRRRVGLTGFACKCGGVFCGEHRYAEAHACEFDHKGAERRKIAADNPVVVGSKLDRL
ncbi:unnamed protein product [Ostreobium quekettii]|uniref:Uncharacterized protein n=1 Tax=Ostreobium quekettii TaxID=121088 RepID=A0A8S1J2V0_9CHLO|nr:unnamed protein product [Ostreobium quekettii]|eukprot:evm.model.scf_1567.2 EVM.evm.TU.scf_1567.2   scf_1567:36409-37215(-)